MNGGKRRKYVTDQLYSIRKAGHIIMYNFTCDGRAGGWVGICYMMRELISMFNELLLLSKSWSLRETTFLNQSPGPISLMITSSSKTGLILRRFCSQHVDVDMREELMKLRVSFDKSGFPDPLISQTPRRVIYAFFISSRSQFVLMHRRVLHFNFIPQADLPF